MTFVIRAGRIEGEMSLFKTIAPAIAFMSDAVLIFYGLSMLLAALSGYGGGEWLAISNWLLGRDDQLGCLVFSPIDQAALCVKAAVFHAP